MPGAALKGALALNIARQHGDGLCTVADVQFSEDALHVIFHGVDT
jgi:hypothetical protein